MKSEIGFVRVCQFWLRVTVAELYRIQNNNGPIKKMEIGKQSLSHSDKYANKSQTQNLNWFY